MANVYEVDATKLVGAVAQRLKAAGLSKPAYVGFVKSGVGKERVPSQEDFWYIRCASILRQVFIDGTVGVSRLRTRYGNRKKHEARRHHHYDASGSIIRNAFHAMEKMGYLEKAKKGRIITAKGKSLLDKAAGEIIGK